MDKISYGNFNNKDVVSGLQRKLALDKSQFEGLPQGAMQIEDVKVSSHDNKREFSFNNLSYVRILARPIDMIKQIEAIKGMPAELRNQTIANIPLVSFKVEFNDDDASRKNYEFLSEHGLFDNAKGKVLAGIEYIVTWDFLTQYGDILTLKVPDITNVKVSD